jgi:hypothetical protein
MAQAETDPLKRESKYLITISTNRRPFNATEAVQMKTDLADALHRVFHDEDALSQFIFFNKPLHNMNNIDKINTKIGTEVGTGKRGQRVHAHVVFHIKHHSNISLKIPESVRIMRNLFLSTPELQKYNLPNLYINIRLMRNEAAATARYISKQLQPQTSSSSGFDIKRRLNLP